MSRPARDLGIGAVLAVAGLVMFVVFHDVETPVIGLRQAGLVIAALGLIELAVAGWSMLRSRRLRDR